MEVGVNVEFYGGELYHACALPKKNFIMLVQPSLRENIYRSIPYEQNGLWHFLHKNKGSVNLSNGKEIFFFP